MANTAGISPKDPNKYTGLNTYTSNVVTRKRSPTGADYRQPETGKLYPIACQWIVGKNPTTGIEGDIWYLSKIVANVAYWIQIAPESQGPLQEITVQQATAPGVNPVVPTAPGNIDFNGSAVVNHGMPIETRSRAANAMNVEVQYSGSATSTNATLNGLSHFDSSTFSVDANGFVTATGNSWVEVTSTPYQAAYNKAYLMNSGGLITITLPVTAAKFTYIRICGFGAGGYLIAQNANQLIHVGDKVTTTGILGSLASVNQYACIYLLCVVADTTWVALSGWGDFTVV